MIRVACIEGDASLRRMLEIVLGEAGYEVITRPGAAGLQAFLRRERPDVLLLELCLDGASVGLRTLEELRAHPETSALGVIVCSGDIRSLRAHDRAVRAWNCAILEKPYTADALLGAIRRATDRPRDATGSLAYRHA